MHVAAAIGTPTMGIFGPTSPDLWAPLNGSPHVMQTKTELPCQPCQRTVCTMNDHRCMRDIRGAYVAEHRVAGACNPEAAATHDRASVKGRPRFSIETASSITTTATWARANAFAGCQMHQERSDG